MKKGCLIVFIVVIALIGGGIAFLYSAKDSIIEGIQDALTVPPHGEKDFIEANAGAFLRSLDAAADAATSAAEFEAAVKALEAPAELLYVGVTAAEGDEDKVDVIKNFDWSGKSHLIFNGYGAGTLTKGSDSRDVMIYENDGSWSYMDSFTVYIQHTGPAEEAAP